MLASVFSKVLNMSLTASIAIVAVYFVRLLLQKAPKIYSYLLWGVVLLRLLCPVSVFSSVSLIPDKVSTGQIVSGWEESYVGEVQIHHDNRSEYTAAVEAGRTPVSGEEGHYYVVTGDDGISAPKTVENTVMPIAATLWVTGIALMGIYSIVCYLRIRKQTRVAVPLGKNVYLADDVDSPFVMGIFRPVIYLPGTLAEAEQTYIIAHERHHIRRGDHIFKALGFLALTIHWFNPLVWLAFVLAGRDMEMSCDEAVILKFGSDIRAEYSASLLNLATGHRLFSITPLAFGEGSPTGRVRNLAKWKKPTFWVALICVIFSAVLAVCLLTNPVNADGILIANSIVYRQDAAASDSLPRGSTEIGRLQAIESEVQVTDPAKFYGVKLKKRYIGMPIFQSGTDENTIYLVAGGDGFLPFVKEESAKPTEPPITEPSENTSTEEDWGVSLMLGGASSTGAGWYFADKGIAPGELTYDKFFSLEQLVDGVWTDPNALVCADLGTDPDDQKYMLQDGLGWYVQWQDTMGSLPDGYYRIGKLVTLTHPDGTGEEKMFYYPFTLKNGVIPLEELPANYGFGDQAVYDGCFTQSGGLAMSNKQLFKIFADITQEGTPSFIRIVNTHYGKKDRFTVHDLLFDGTQYTISWIENGQRQSRQFRYLRHFSGKAEDGPKIQYAYDVFDHYYLTNEDILLWETIRDKEDEPDRMCVYSDYVYNYEEHYISPEIPEDIIQADLVFEGERILTVTNDAQLKNLRDLFATAEIISGEPKTHSIGIGLNLVLTCRSGDILTLELDPDQDLCRMDGAYIHYGRYDEPSYLYDLWLYLGIPAWPDAVYEKYPNACKP